MLSGLSGLSGLSAESAGDNDMIVGEIRLFAFASLPAGWLALGQNVSRTTYAALFAAIGTTWGSGNGTTTFGLPPIGYAPIPAGAQSGLTTRALGATFGVETVTLTSDQSGLPAHTHTLTAGFALGSAGAGAGGDGMQTSSITTDQNGTASAAQAHTNLGPRMAMTFGIYAGV